MASRNTAPATQSETGFRIVGQVHLLETDHTTHTPTLSAYVFDPFGDMVGMSPIADDGKIDLLVRIGRPVDVELVIGPPGEPQYIRSARVYTQRISAQQWTVDAQTRTYRLDLELPRAIWRPWVPVSVCITGHVRKATVKKGATTYLPVPFVTVEVFDVDRNQLNLGKLFPSRIPIGPVLRIPKLIRKPKFPPDPDPGAEIFFPIKSDPGSLDPEDNDGSFSFDSPFEPSHQALELFANKTITSRLAPWRIFPITYYSKQRVATTNTNCSGYFNTCFTWQPFQFRHGRFRYDAHPDVVLRITQTIDGVSTVIYLDPYTHTRWNTTSTHIDLYLDDERIITGCGICASEPGNPVFYTRIGNDEVYQIDQSTGLYQDVADTDVAYGATLSIHGVIGDSLSTGAPKRYYRLSTARAGTSHFVPLAAPLYDTRVSKTTFVSDSYALGPHTVNGVNALYEVRDKSNFHWYSPDLLAVWNTHLTEEESATYVLRLELFDENGVKLTTADGIEYLDGTDDSEGDLLPPMADRCDLVITIDNQLPEVILQVPATTNPCGVIQWMESLRLAMGIRVSQPSQRLRKWSLSYSKGLGAQSGVLAAGYAPDGKPGTIAMSVPGGAAAPLPGTHMLAHLDTTCTFSLTLRALAHIRNGYSFIYETSQTKTIAIEKCERI